MRGLMTVGALSLAGALVWSCSDDGGADIGNGGSGGQGGSAGSGGSAGTLGNAGSGNAGSGNAGTGGVAGSGNAGSGNAGSGNAGSGNAGSGNAGSGNAGSGNQPDAGDAGLDGDAAVGDAGDAAAAPPCTGCMELRVPFTAPNQAAFFQITFSADLSDTVATFRVRALLLDDQLFVTPFATDGATGGFVQGSGTFTVINAGAFGDTETFINLPFTVSTATPSSGTFDPTDSIALGLQLGSGASFVGPTTAVLLLDSVSYTGSSGLQNLDFAVDAQNFGINVNAGLQAADGVQVIYH